MSETRKAVIKNADMSEEMQQEAVDCASEALNKFNIEKASIFTLSLRLVPLACLTAKLLAGSFSCRFNTLHISLTDRFPTNDPILTRFTTGHSSFHQERIR